MDKSKGFRCDESTKAEFSSFIKAVFSACTCLVIDTPMDEQSPMDLYLTAKTDYSAYTYAFELKERDGRYPSDRYGIAGKGGWIVEDHKIQNFKEAEAQGYNACYVNFYPDNVIRIWNISKAPEGVMEHRGEVRKYNAHTVDDEGGTYRKAKVEIFNYWAKDYRRDTYEPLD